MNKVKEISNEERCEILNNRKSFPFYREYENTFKELTNEEAGKLLTALMDYQFYGLIPDFSGDRILSVTFNAMKGGMDAAINQYVDTVLKNRVNGQKGGRPQRVPQETQPNPVAPNLTQVNPKNPDGYSETDWGPDGFFKTQPVNLKPSGPQWPPTEPNLTQVNPIREDKIGEDKISKDMDSDAEGVPYKGHPNGRQTEGHPNGRRVFTPPYDNNKIFMATTEADGIASNEFRFEVMESLEVFDQYFKAYRKFTGKDHPPITLQNMASLIDKMPACYCKAGDREISLTSEDYANIIETYFETDFHDCDRNINHFFSGDVRGLRLLEIENGRK